MGKYFGTDGFRGEANVELTAEHAHKIGRFLGWYFEKQNREAGKNGPVRVAVGKDTRRSGYMLEYALVGGLAASGARAVNFSLASFPSVAARFFSAFSSSRLTRVSSPATSTS